MRALVYDVPKQFSVKEIETPEPKAGEVRIKAVSYTHLVPEGTAGLF